MNDYIKLKMNLLQINPNLVCSDTGVKKLEYIIYRLASQKKKPAVIALPKIYLKDQYIKNRLKVVAKKMSVNIILGSKDGMIYFIDREGNLTICRDSKVNLNIFDIDGVCCGAISDDDIRSPKITGKSIFKDIKILFVIASWPKRKENHWNLLNIIRAIENKCFVVAVNGIGRCDEGELIGRTLVINPWGKLMIEGEEKAVIFSSTLNLQWVDEARAEVSKYNSEDKN